jgi:hypothetical protein
LSRKEEPKKMHCIAFVTDRNTSGKHDATGAFIPAAHAWAEVHGGRVVPVQCVGKTPLARRNHVIATLRALDSILGHVAFFGHGWPDGIQFGFYRWNSDTLAAAISDRVNTQDGVSVALYTCLTAENDVVDADARPERAGVATDGGFADVLRDNLVRCGVTSGHVDAHKTAGHAAFNPNVIRFECYNPSVDSFGVALSTVNTGEIVESDMRGIGGQWIVAPGSALWHAWVMALGPQSTSTMRYRFPMMTVAEIEAELRAHA